MEEIGVGFATMGRVAEKIRVAFMLGAAMLAGPVAGAAEAAPVNHAEAAPVNHAEAEAVKIQLQDPLGADSKTYLDLDTGQTFTRGECPADDLFESRRWIREHGIDVMCESRQPAEGLVVYDLAFKVSDLDFDHPPAYSTLRQMFQKADPQPFEFLSSGTGLPKTYLFQTSDRALGILEISSFMKEPSGIALRYHLIRPPARPAMSLPNQPGGRGATMGAVVKHHQEQLEKLRQRLGDANPQVERSHRDLVMYQDMAKIEATETDPALAALKMQKIASKYTLEMWRAKYPDQSRYVIAGQRQLDVIEDQIKDLQTQRQAKAAEEAKARDVTPTTRPG